ncbi:MAG: TRAP transporter small permease [Deltaproteobacteria bacterium]|nr:TRAP transporter small permease [Deltaproteobacteria bacterium]
MGKFLDRVCRAIAVIACFLLLFMTFSIGYSIFTRSLDLPTPVWVVQINEYVLLWITFLATSWILRKGGHVSIQLVVQRLGVTSRKVLSLIHCVLGLAVSATLTWFGYYTTRNHFVRGVIDVGSVDVPKAWVLAIIPVGFLFLTLQFLRKLVEIWSDKEAKD